MIQKKERLDKVLFENGFFDSKNKAQAAIMAGDVKINGETITKSGYQILLKPDTQIEIKTMPFVSRGGFKLQKALDIFKINLNNRICLDAGASTGGFTDCMLQQNAKKVYAVDVGYGQIAWKLRNNNKVKIIERVNIKNCDFSDIYTEQDEIADFCAMDLSFISIKKVLENVLKMLQKNAEIVTLIKPQFEAGKNFVGKNGVVRDKEIHLDIINSLIEYSKTLELKINNLTYSPIKGPAGNIEYLALFSTFNENNNEINIAKIIDNAFENLNN